MRKIKFKLVFFTTLIFLYSCAKPTVVEVVMPEDEKLNCEQLKNAITESKKLEEMQSTPKKEQVEMLLG